MLEKVCTRCGKILALEFFYPKKNCKSGLTSACKTCTVQASKKWVEEHPDRARSNNTRWRFENPEVNTAWRKSNPASDRASRNRWESKAYKTNPEYRLRKVLRARINELLRTKIKIGSAIRDLGCSVEFLRQHLEKFFTEGMSWENYGYGFGNWTLDHIVPLVAFNLQDRQHFLLANHYLNLQPMWYEDNVSKRDTIPEVR